jgi:hypothetical protein
MPSYRLKLVGHAFVRRGSQQHRPSAFEVVHSFGYPADLLGQIVEAPNARLELRTFRDHSGRYPNAATYDVSPTPADSLCSL